MMKDTSLTQMSSETCECYSFLNALFSWWFGGMMGMYRRTLRVDRPPHTFLSHEKDEHGLYFSPRTRQIASSIGVTLIEVV